MTSLHILTVEKQGRHRYFKFTNDEVAQVVESMASLIPLSNKYQKTIAPKLTGFTFARTCYDHLAGRLGVSITQALVEQGIIEISGKDYIVATLGKKWFSEIGLDIDSIILKKRSFAHQCLDWSERKHHKAGALGAALLEKMLSKDWIRRKQYSREIMITSKGKLALNKILNLDF